jgi:glutathione S-transferase
MSLVLHYHPLASFCWKPLIALYENNTPFQSIVVDLGNEASREAFFKLWPLGKFPVLEDKARGSIVPESSIVIEYLAQYYPGAVDLVSTGDRARQIRLMDRFFDSYVQEPMQKIVGDRLRPQRSTDPYGVERAREQLRRSYAMIDKDMAGKEWATGDAFTMADCAAMPALFYANKVEPFDPAQTNLIAYHERLLARPSAARVIEEAKPYFHLFPYNEGPA